MHKKVYFTTESRSKLKAGVDILANAVKVTLGPGGRNVIIEKTVGQPTITKDGVSVAKEIILEDPVENMGAALIKSVASKTADQAGDGTTTATVLAQAIIEESVKYIDRGFNVVDIKRGMDKATEHLISELNKAAIKIESVDADIERIRHIATVSANGDKVTGDIITDAVKAVGKSGFVSVEEGPSKETILKEVEGMEFESGFLSSHFINEAERQRAIYEKAYVLIINQNVSVLNDFLDALEFIADKNVPLLIVADDITGEALSALVVNNLNKTIKVVAVKAPFYKRARTEFLTDLAVFTGATIISPESTISLPLTRETVESALGYCEKVVVSKDSTLVVSGRCDVEKMEQHLTAIKSTMDDPDYAGFREHNAERVARLGGRVAVISVGGNSEVEVKEKRDRVDDAVAAVKAAIQEGIVPGGGTALLKASKQLNNLKGSNKDEQLGIDIIKEVVKVPLKQICINAGVQEPGAVVQDVLKSKGNIGYNARTLQLEDLIDSGVIDPVKVTKSALTHAVSVASMLITTDCSIIRVPSKEQQTPNYYGGQ